MQALEEEEDGEEETVEFIPIDSVDMTGEEEESDSEEQQPSSPIVSPKRTGQKQTKKTSITPDLSEKHLMQLHAVDSFAESLDIYSFSCI